MADISKEQLMNLATLSRIHCGEEEQKELIADLAKILDYIAQLDEVATEGVKPCNHVLEAMENVTREDTPEQTLAREAFLSNAPDQIGGMIKVPPVIQKKKS